MNNKIFEFINKLNQKKTEESIVNILQVTNDTVKSKRNLIPILITIAILLFIILAGIFTVKYYPYLISSLISKNNFIISTNIANSNLQNGENNTVVFNQINNDNKDLKESNIVKSNTKTEEKTSTTTSNNTSKEENQSEIKDTAVIINKSDFKEDIKEKTTKNITQITIKNEQDSNNIIRLSENDLSVLQKEKEARKKRLLHQAENYRIKGDFISAMNLYKIVWDEYKDPNAANNLAAILIIMQKYDDAKTILEEAKKISPDDPDINYNLSLVEEISLIR